MIALLLLTGPATYLLRVAGLLLARTRLVPRQMSSRLALVSPAVLAALVAPSLVRPAGVLAVNPLTNPRLLVALLVLPLLLALRRHTQAALCCTVVVGMGLLWALGWLSGLALLLVAGLLAGAGLVVLARLLQAQRQPQRMPDAATDPLPASPGGVPCP
jgi:branched-subunit amino acid transport protein